MINLDWMFKVEKTPCGRYGLKVYDGDGNLLKVAVYNSLAIGQREGKKFVNRWTRKKWEERCAR